MEPLREWIRLNAVERIHLTLHFLGHLPVDTVAALQVDLAPVIRKHRRFRLEAKGVGAFPSIGRAQVIWAGITGADLPQLTRLQADLSPVLRQAGVVIEDRFHPHLTFGRVRRPIRGPSRKLVTEWQARWRDTSFGALDVDDVALMRSQLGAGPPRYTTVARFSLQ